MPSWKENIPDSRQGEKMDIYNAKITAKITA
jgi:hypothetical protein